MNPVLDQQNILNKYRVVYRTVNTAAAAAAAWIGVTTKSQIAFF